MDKENKKKGTIIKALIIFLLFFIFGYISFVFLPIPGIRDLRNLYIETAMTTSHHQYLAKWLIPHSVINDVMNNRITTTSIISVPINKKNKSDDNDSITLVTSKSNLERKIKESNYNKDILNLKSYKVGDLDSKGNEIIVNDIENGIQIVQINEFGFKANLALIEDPGQVYVSYAADAKYKGYVLQEYLEKTKAIMGINASGFDDPDGVGLGTDSAGRTYASEEEYSRYVEKYNTFGFDKDDNFVVGHFYDWDEKNMRDAVQFNPALIIDGKDQTIGKTGWGLHPRTCIGQTKDGVVAMLTIDGRSADSLLGGSIKKAAEILLKYDVVNAANCDGGASTIMAYDGKIINDVSYKYKQGRYLPNAFLVKTRKQYLQDLEKVVEQKKEIKILDEKYPIKTEEIDLSNKKIEDLEQFKQEIVMLPRLKTLDLSNTNLSNWECMSIRSLLKGKTYVIWTVQIAGYEIKTNVKTFSVNVNENKNKMKKITSEDAELFQFCTDLQAVDLGNQSITDINFIPKYMPDLRVLILNGNKITDISPLSRLQKLHYLEIYIVSEKVDIAPLSQITSLVDLLICYYGESINIDIISHLSKLDRFSVILLKATEIEIQKLQAAYPKVQIVASEKELKNSWRVHRRYKIIQDMFLNNTIDKVILNYD